MDAPPHAGPLSPWTGLLRQFDYHATVFLRTWRGNVISGIVSPIFYVLAMGVVLGGFIPGDPGRLEGATSYLQFVAPGLVAAHAMQLAMTEMTYPVMGGLKWHKSYFAQVATPLSVRDVANAHLAFSVVRVAIGCGLFMLVLLPFGIFATWWGWILALGVQILLGAAFSTLTMAFSVRVRSESGFGVLFRVGMVPMMLFSGAFFPVANLGEAGAWLARLTPLWHGVHLSRMLCVGQVDAAVAAANVAVLLLLTALGWRLAVTGLERRMEV